MTTIRRSAHWPLLVLAIAAACTVSPFDGEEVGPVASDGIPPPVPYRGYAVGKQHIMRVHQFYWGNYQWFMNTITTAADTPAYASSVSSEGLFEWEVDVAYDDIWDVTPVGETVVTRSAITEATQEAPLSEYPTNTYDTAGITCLTNRVMMGDDPGVAGKDCATGETQTNTFDVPRGETLMVDNIGLTQCTANVLMPYPSEAMHLGASRMSPPATPYQVEKIAYIVGSGAVDGGGGRCDASMAHDVLVFSSAIGAPPDAAPKLIAEIPNAIPGGASDGAYPTEVQLGSPYVVEEGEELYVALRFPHDGKNRLCQLVCDPVEITQPGRHWWSNAKEPPYPWSELSTFSLDYIPQFRLIGRVLP